ncbi:MAG: tetratricopeptide repeat protein [Aquificae bacterium]|nr:tetratricopeptide repeat protein [Aquificota bacterium]
MKGLVLILLLLAAACTPPNKLREEGDWRYYYDLGMSSYYAKNFSEAVAQFHRAIKINPKEPKVWNALGLTYRAVKEYDRAEAAFKKALQIDPSFSEARMNLGILYLETGRLQEAERFLKEAVSDELFEKKHIAYFYLAKVYREMNREKDYIENLEKAVNYNPLYIEAQLELARAYEEAGLYDEAERIYKNLMANDLGSTYVLYKLAEVYYKKGDYLKARKIIKRLLFQEKLDEEQKEKVKDLLTKILIAQQRKVVSFERELEREEKVRKKEEREGKYAVQIAAFSSRERAEKLIKSLEEKGLKGFKVQEVAGIYKVLYGSFATKEEAYRAREELRRYNIYGFVVELN